MINIEKLAEQLANLTIKDVNNLANILKDKYGVEPFQVSSTFSSSTDKVVDKLEEKSHFDVILKSSGTTKLKVIKAVKDLLGKSLTEAKELVDSAPNAILKSGEIKSKAEDLKSKLEDFGAEIELV